MMGRSTLVALLLAWSTAALGASACGGAPPTAVQTVTPQAIAADLAYDPLGLVPGETMAFEVRIGGLLAGEAALAVGDAGELDGRRVIAVRSRIASAGAAALVKHVVDESTSVIDLATARPLTMAADVAYGSIRYHTDATFEGTKVAVELTREGKPKVIRQVFEFGTSTAHDAHSAMAAIRTWRPDPGATRTLWVMGGRRVWRSDVTFVGRESLGTSLGNVAALRLDGIGYRLKSDRSVDTTKVPRHFTVWMSDDADRVPLRVQAETELGDVTIDLLDYNRP
jgi:hypothetical protein